ncbi:MAG: zinc-dependent alcohol dehydrogenase [Anaerolineales bacterium]
MRRTSLYFVSPRQVELRDEDLPSPRPGEIQVSSSISYISAGTEMLLFNGEFPQDLVTDSTLSSLKGNLKFPFKYGYSMVGSVSAIRDGVESHLRNQAVFALNPHENAFNVKDRDMQIIPNKIPEKDAVFLANAETAVNLILDGAPLLGEKVVVIGQGVVGLLTTALLAKHPLEMLITFEPYPMRLEASRNLGAHEALDTNPQSVNRAQGLLGDRGADLVYELSGRPEALDLALSLVGDDGRIVIGSWYGERKAAIDLGARFHRGRIKLISSQVSRIAPEHTGRWDRQRRFAEAWKLIDWIRPSQFVTHEFPFADAGKAYRQLADNPQETMAVLLIY